MRYLITGANGQIGSRVVERLVQAGCRPRLLVRDAGKALSRFEGSVDVFKGELGDSGSLEIALNGIDSVFLLNSGPEIPQLDEMAGRLANAAGVGHVVKLSALSAAEALAIGAWHAEGEAAIRTSGVAYTFLRPAGFMSNTLEWARSIRAQGVVRACTGDGRVAYIHPDDVAAVAAKVLITGQYHGDSLHLTGPRLMSYAEMTSTIGAVIGRELSFEAISDPDALDRLTSIGMPAIEAEALVSLWRAIREGKLATVSTGVADILGKPPISFERWVEENATSYR